MNRFPLNLFMVFWCLGWSSPSFAMEIGIPCIDSSGNVANANEAEVCKSILPKCVDLKNSMIDNMKSMISWKIYGYYQLNKDIDLTKNKSDPSQKINPSQIEGVPLPYPVCSVVGHSVKANEEGEIIAQKSGGRLSCGNNPRMKGAGFLRYHVDMEYVESTNWFSYVMGAFPWELRRNAYDVSVALNDNLDNLGKVVSSLDQQEDILKTLEEVKKQTLMLSAAAKSSCVGSAAKGFDILEGCKKGTFSISDPVHSLCTLSKAQLALNSVAIPNILVFEVMKRTQKMHQDLFGKIFVGGGKAGMDSLINFCRNNDSLMNRLGVFFLLVPGLNAIKANKSYSCYASCMTDGDEYYTSQINSPYSWKNGGGAKQRKCQKRARYNLNTGQPYRDLLSTLLEPEDFLVWLKDLLTGWFQERKSTGKSPFEEGQKMGYATNSVGFAGLIESKIRRDICQQRGSKTADNPCDKIEIPDVPKDVSGG